MVIVRHFAGSVKQYSEAESFPGRSFTLPRACPHPECGAVSALIRWGTYERWVCTDSKPYRIRVQRIRCKVCLRTHSLLPDFAHPHRQYQTGLLHLAISLYLFSGLSLRCLLKQLPGLARSTVRGWINSFAYGAGELLLSTLTRRLAALNPLAEWPDKAPPQHLERVRDPRKRHRLERAYQFLLLAEPLYAQTKAHDVRLHFEADQLFPFLLHWLQNQALPPRLFYSPTSSTTPTTPS